MKADSECKRQKRSKMLQTLSMTTLRTNTNKYGCGIPQAVAKKDPFSLHLMIFPCTTGDGVAAIFFLALIPLLSLLFK